VLLASLAVACAVSGAGTAGALDIEVYGLNVLPVKNGVPQSGSLNAGAPGVEYYLLCSFKPVGSTPKTATRFVFRANGVVLRDVYAPVEANKTVAMGEKWTPASTGTYSLTCQANPDHQPAETTYVNNQKTKSFSVKKLTIKPDAEAMKLMGTPKPGIQPGKAVEVPGLEPGKSAVIKPLCPAGWHLTGPPSHDGKQFFCAPNKPPKLNCATPDFVYFESKEGGLIGCHWAFDPGAPPRAL
jgi:hypothetical protein